MAESPGGKIVEEFARLRGIGLSNGTSKEHFYRKHFSAAVMLFEMANRDLEIAMLAMKEISRYLDRLVVEKKIDCWRNLNAVTANYLEWRAEYDKDKIKRTYGDSRTRR